MKRSWCLRFANWFILLLVLFVAGCSKPPSPAPALSQNITITGIINYDVVIELPSGGLLGIAEGSTIQQDGKSFELKGGTLRMNGESFGDVTKGDKVKLEQSGRLLVNGKPRDPVTDAK